MAKKKTKSSSKRYSSDEKSIKALVAFFTLLLAFGVLLVFNRFQENILSSSLFQTLIVLTVFLFALLIALLFLVNPQRNKR